MVFRPSLRRWFRLVLPLLLIGLGLAPIPARAAEPTALLFLLSDQHSAYALTAQVVARIDALRSAHPAVPAAVLIDGDIFEAGNPVAHRSAGEIDYAMLTALAARLPTVVNIGNHEAEFADLVTTITRLRATGAIVLTNLTHADSGEPFAPPTATLRLGSTTLALVGLATPDFSTYPAAVRPTLAAPAPADWLQAHLTTAFPTGTTPVVLSHAGVTADRALLPILPAGTLLVGGHNHLRFVHEVATTGVVYVHTGCWNEALSIARLEPTAAGAGAPHWTVTQTEIHANDPADPALAALIATVRARELTATDLAPVGQAPTALTPPAAARFAVAAVHTATGADAAFIGNTTFGAGLAAGPIAHVDFDAWIRFDGTLCTAEIDGRQLAALLAAANPGPDTPFADRHGEFLYAAGPDPATLDPTRTYRIATNDWGARNTARYFGAPDLTWTPHPDLKLKATARAALVPPAP